MVEEHLIKSEIQIERGKVVDIFEDENVSVDSIVFRMSKNDVGHINESHKTKAIPTTKLLIKYHKKLKMNGYFPSILVTLTINFSANFVMVGTWV